MGYRLYREEALLRLAAADDRGAAGQRSGRPAGQEWYDVNWNPIIGCTAVGPGCAHCDAMQAAAQLARMGGKSGAQYSGLVRMDDTGPAWTGEVRVRDDLLTWPLFRRGARRILVGATSDLFHERIPNAVLDRLHAVVAVARRHRFLVLTKRAERMRGYYDDPQTPCRILRATEALPISAPAIPSGDWPLPNLWVGVSIEDEDHIFRLRELAATPAALRWAAFEPLLGPVRPDAVPIADGLFDALRGIHYRLDGRGRPLGLDRPPWPALDWVLAGGETGAGARPTHPDWVRRLRDLCTAARVPFFFKQWGEWAPAEDERFGRRMVRLGRRAAGRRLDGAYWNQMPRA
ncbi:MAG TPA: DUF5131 family protein [Stellaceae bacterium]|jgi:protein gp37